MLQISTSVTLIHAAMESVRTLRVRFIASAANYSTQTKVNRLAHVRKHVKYIGNQNGGFGSLSIVVSVLVPSIATITAVLVLLIFGISALVLCGYIHIRRKLKRTEVQDLK